MLGKKLFGEGIKYQLRRFAGLIDRRRHKRLYLDFSGYKCTKSLISGAGARN
jgi:hypothetical protein